MFFRNAFHMFNEIPPRRIIRCGVIPYFVTKTGSDESNLWLAVGVDSKSGEMTDFGGRRYCYNFLERIETCAARELYEETIGLFDIRCLGFKILQFPVVTDGSICIFFIRFEEPPGWPGELGQLFEERKTFEHRSSFLENSMAYWIRLDDFLKVLEIKTKRSRICRPIHKSKITAKDSNCLKILTPDDDKICHPKMYETIRKMLYALNWKAVENFLRNG